MDEKQYKKFRLKYYGRLALGCLTFVFWAVLYFAIPGTFDDMNLFEKSAVIGSIVYPLLWMVYIKRFISKKAFREYEKYYWTRRSQSQTHRARAEKLYRFLSVKFFVVTGILGIAGWIALIQLCGDKRFPDMALPLKGGVVFLLLYTVTFFVLLILRASIKKSRRIEDYYLEQNAEE